MHWGGLSLLPTAPDRFNAIQAVTLSAPPGAEALLVELAADVPSRFNTICSLVFAARLKVTCSGFDP